ncbi:hypothetical protein [Bacteroides sp.]|uniref:hypothetical protein n=1 Tax=Bacteroides sp. TaxID=29523 RepID=UPI002639CBEE|nr:hypothetical protein [Bacteroides sp.]MDD3039705.1 hypothetical protein [Bacteroides sp.]
METTTDERRDKVIQAGPKAEVSYVCDEDGNTVVTIKGTGAAIIFGLLNIVENFSKSNGKKAEETILHLLQVYPIFALALRKKSEKKDEGGN